MINEDIIAPQHGFGMHPHQDMEILTYILSGTIEHQDSMGNHTQLHAGEFQIMSAGSGVHHAEINQVVSMMSIYTKSGSYRSQKALHRVMSKVALLTQKGQP